MTKPRFWDYFFVAVQFALFAVYFLPVELAYSLPQLALWPAQLAIIIGLLLVFVALKQIGIRISPFPRPRPNSELITGGVFALVRHPIYSGIFLFAVGLALYKEDLFKLLIAIALLVLFFFKSAYEEKNMMERFEGYESYRKRVGRFFPKLRRA